MTEIVNTSDNATISLYNKILNSELFDPEWYARTYHINEKELSYPEINNAINQIASNKQKNNLLLVAHYMTVGWKKGFDPCFDFSTSSYIADYIDIREAGINPLDHYITYGINKKRVIQPHQDWPKFSIIMATYNRRDKIENAIDSALKQVTEFDIKYELIIADDGSEDGTIQYLRNKYEKEITIGLITLLPLKHSGLSAARNTAVLHSKYEWICYLDDDNTLRPNFLDTFSKEIIRNRNSKFIYGQHLLSKEKIVTEHEYNRCQLLKGNYIDIGSTCHTKEIFNKVGGFDESLTRYEDWDLIIRITSITTPVYIPEIVMDYSSEQEYKRISNTVSSGNNIAIIQEKHHQESCLLKYIENLENVNHSLCTKIDQVRKQLENQTLSITELQSKHQLEINKLTIEIHKVSEQQEQKINSLLPLASAIVTKATILKFKILKSITFGEKHQKYKMIYKGLKNLYKVLNPTN